MVGSPAASNKTLKFEVLSTALLSAQHVGVKRPTGWLGVRIMVRVGTSLSTRGPAGLFAVQHDICFFIRNIHKCIVNHFL